MREACVIKRVRGRYAASLAPALLLALVGCATKPDVVVMKNPATSQTAECRRYPWGSVIEDDIAQCVLGYKAEGWITISSR